MAEVREKAFSTSLTADVGSRVKTIALRENRSFAVKVFTLLPRDVRDMLVEAATADDGRKRLAELSRSLLREDAMRRIDEAAKASAPHMKLEPQTRDYDDAVVVERRS
jgi:hypothetical protein